MSKLMEILQNQDFEVYSDTGILIHTDAPDHSVGIGTATPSASFMLDVARRCNNWWFNSIRQLVVILI